MLNAFIFLVLVTRNGNHKIQGEATNMPLRRELLLLQRCFGSLLSALTIAI